MRSSNPSAARDFRAYTKALISAASRRDVGRAFVETGVMVAGARGGNLYVARDGALHLLAASGDPEEALVPCRMIPLSANAPHAEVFRTLEPAWLGAADAIGDRFAAMRDLLRATGDGAWSALPLPGEAGPLGVIGLQFAGPQRFDEEQRTLLVELAGLTAGALERAGRHDDEREARTFQHRLIGIAGHELRNPLTVVLSSAEQLARGAAGDRDKRASARLLRNARRMDRVVRDLVDYAQAQAEGRLHIAPREVDFHDLCVRVLASLSSLHPERPVTYQRGEDGRGRWDPDRLEEVLENLLVNALKYGAADRPVYIGWYAEPTELVLKVHNHGPPIPAAVLPFVFDPFRRGEEHCVRDSLGLGLYIVRQIVAAHGGRVDVRSDREAGTTFVVHLPFAAPAVAARDLAS
ncbi:MAG: ATP-binding protein [Myxococcales bacterium]